MFRSLQVASVILVAIAMALALAHALELPGKLRLGKEAYLTVQQIYYPGFTIGGFAEIGGLILLLILLFLTPYAGARFWWTAAAFASLLTMHLTYWFVTHPVNNFWVKDIELAGLGSMFFNLFAVDPGADWRKLRNIWEYSHVARAVFGMFSLISLTIAVTT